MGNIQLKFLGIIALKLTGAKNIANMISRALHTTVHAATYDVNMQVNTHTVFDEHNRFSRMDFFCEEAIGPDGCNYIARPDEN
ncbi:MAG: hypothetical protein COS89_08910 [Deltaproteobacteria bacterium CG07_land_8_20_14_0_80_38_7]|nr:MAG: hypothetical protein COS89_08910 [Deltaproteobacteria bacterium CG07_land_8_20_14_0_80_38_7]